MQMLSIENADELQCLSDLMNSAANQISFVCCQNKFVKGPDGVGLQGEYFTSGADYKTNNEFVWCSANSTAVGTNLFWKSGEPNFVSDTGAEESCVTLTIEYGVLMKNVISDKVCAESFKYICEVIKKTLQQIVLMTHAKGTSASDNKSTLYGLFLPASSILKRFTEFLFPICVFLQPSLLDGNGYLLGLFRLCFKV